MDIDWETGRYGTTDAGAARVVVAGDWAAIRGFAPLLIEDPAAAYGDLLPVLRGADLRIVNLESPLTDGGEPIAKDGPNLRGSPAAIAALTAVPWHVACLANNHAMDYGPQGLDDTRTLLDEAGIRAVGAGRVPEEAYAPLVVEAGSVRLGIVNFCEGEDCTSAWKGEGVFGWDVTRVVRMMETLARHGVDATIVIAHCGREYAPVPPPYVVAAFRRIAEAGAAAVIGHHPHVPQGIEVHEGCLIVYSLGNFVFDQPVDRFFRRAGYLVELALSGEGVSGFRIVPYRIEAGGLHEMTGPERAYFLSQLCRVSKPLSSADAVRAVWEAFIDRMGEEELVSALARMANELEGARRWAVLRNRFVTPAHYELWVDATTRLIEGQMGTAPGWAREMVDEWATRPVLREQEDNVAQR